MITTWGILDNVPQNYDSTAIIATHSVLFLFRVLYRHTAPPC